MKNLNDCELKKILNAFSNPNLDLAKPSTFNIKRTTDEEYYMEMKRLREQKNTIDLMKANVELRTKQIELNRVELRQKAIESVQPTSSQECLERCLSEIDAITAKLKLKLEKLESEVDKLR